MSSLSPETYGEFHIPIVALPRLSPSESAKVSLNRCAHPALVLTRVPMDGDHQQR